MLIVGTPFSCGGAFLATDCFIDMRLVFLRCFLFKKCASSDGDQNGLVVCAHVRRFHMSRTAFAVIPNSLANRQIPNSLAIAKEFAKERQRTANLAVREAVTLWPRANQVFGPRAIFSLFPSFFFLPLQAKLPSYAHSHGRRFHLNAHLNTPYHLQTP